jgi:toxin FitB
VRYLLDTNVLSEMVAARPDPNVINWIQEREEQMLYLSVITLGEIQKGIAKLPASARKDRLAVWLANELIARFSGRIVPLDLAVLLTWGSLTAKWEQAGRPLPAIDSLLAATAVQGEFVLVTRNTADFEGRDVALLNPWESSQAG